jgi:hypothetical protein
MADLNALARVYARQYGIQEQDRNESDHDFRFRVGGWLRAHGKTIEAHEVVAGQRWDLDDGRTSARVGILGALAQTFYGLSDWQREPERQLEDDRTAGAVRSYRPANPFCTCSY